MKKHLKMAAAAAAAVICAGPLSAFSPANEEFIPSGNIIGMININDTQGMWSSFGSSQLVKEIGDILELPAFREGADYEEFLSLTSEAEAELGYEMTPKALLGEKLESLDLYYISKDGGMGTNGLMVLDFVNESDAKNLSEFITKKLKAEIEKNSGDGQATVSLAEKEMEGVSVVVDLDNEIAYGSKGKYFLLAQSESILNAALTSPGSSALDSIKGIQENKAKLGENKGQLSFYLDLAEMTEVPSGFPGSDRDIASSGKTVGVIDFSNGKIKSSYYYKPNQLDELRQESYNTPATTNAEILKYIPASTEILYTTNMLLGDLAQKMWDKKLEEGSPDAGNLMMMEMAAQQTGLSVRDDVLAAFGPQAAVSIKTPAGAGMGFAIPGASIITKVADAEKAAKLKAQFETAVAQQVTQQLRQYNPDAPEAKFNSEQYAGVELRTILIANPMLPLEISHATTGDGYFILGLGKSSVKSALDTASNGEGLGTSTLWREVSASHQGQFNHLAVVDAKSISDFVRGIAPLLMSFGGGASEEDMNNMNEMLDVIGAVGKVYNINAYDSEGLFGDSYFLIP